MGRPVLPFVFLCYFNGLGFRLKLDESSGALVILESLPLIFQVLEDQGYPDLRGR